MKEESIVFTADVAAGIATDMADIMVSIRFMCIK